MIYLIRSRIQTRILKQVAAVSVFNDNIQYEFTEPHSAGLGFRNKPIKAGAYTRQELIDLVEGKMELSQFDKSLRINRKNKLAGITEMVFDLDELDNSNTLSNGSPINILLTYHVTSYEDFMHFESYVP